MLDLNSQFSHFLQSDPDRLHFAAHSHHPWPDVSRTAHLQAWDDAARLIDNKWELILGPILAEAQGYIARQLHLSDPASIVIAPNTHELVCRLLSCLPAGRPVNILTSDSEFHSFSRQVTRLEEDGLAMVERIPTQPFSSFAERLAQASRRSYDLIFVSQVFFNSGFVIEDITGLLAAAGEETMIAIDGYHGFMARPTDLSCVERRIFYLAGGYKYAMSGEGICFMHCPPNLSLRPRDTGWYAAFGTLTKAEDRQVRYAPDGGRFMGATFDPSGLYRFNAVMRWLAGLMLDTGTIHAHAHALGRLLVERLPAGGRLQPAQLVIPVDDDARGNFLTFETEEAADLHASLHRAKVIVDFRGNRLRIGFGIYQTEDDVQRLVERLR